jgi:DNA-binding beta-propeller fold protein YncE
MKPIKNIINAISILNMVFILLACAPESEGVNPPNDQFIYPVAAKVIDNDDYLLVVNSNFDLKYNSGTLMALDLAKIFGEDTTKVTFNSEDGLILLNGISLDEYCDAGLTQTHCNISEQQFILNKETIRLGAYASDLNITPQGDRALVPVRGEKSIITVDINGKDGSLLYCGQNENRKCNKDYRITSNNKVSLPIEPYKVATMDYAYEHNGTQVIETMGFSTHRAGGEVSLFAISKQSGDQQSVLENRLVKVINGVVEGAAGIAVNPIRKDIYIAGQVDLNKEGAFSRIPVLRVFASLEDSGSYLEDPWFSQAATIFVSGKLINASDIRQIAVSPDGKYGFVTVQNPPSLLKIDLNTYEIVDMLTMCHETSALATYLVQDDLESKSTLYAFSLCFLTGQMYVIDTELMIPYIRKTGQGPQDITFDKTRQVALITNFTDSTISMVQAFAPFGQIKVQNPEDETDLRILQIGEPR